MKAFCTGPRPKLNWSPASISVMAARVSVVARCLLLSSRLSFAEKNALTKLSGEGDPLREGALSRDLDDRAPTVELIAADDRLSAALLYVFEAAVTKAPCDRDAEFSAVNGVPDESFDIVEINFTAEAGESRS